MITLASVTENCRGTRGSRETGLEEELSQFRQKMTMARGRRGVDKVMDPESLGIKKNKNRGGEGLKGKEVPGMTSVLARQPDAGR